MYSFSKLLKELRKTSDLTQKDLAKILEVSTVLISMVESGQKQPSKNLIEKLAKKLDVHPASLIPYIYTERGKSIELSKIEKALFKIGLKLQDQLITVKSQNLKSD